MDALGVTESTERKVVTAVGIQFLVTVGIFLTQFLVSGTASYVASGALLFGAVVAIYNTLLIVRRDFVAPIRALKRETEAVAAGEIDRTGRSAADADALDPTQPDEIGSLVGAFDEAHGYLSTVSSQAEALAAQEFDDPALGEDVPGSSGESLDEMAENLAAYTTELESLVDAFGAAAERAQDGDGFAVVADEVKSLAEETRESAAEISGRIEAVQAASAETAADAEAMEAQVAEGVEAIESTLREFEGVVDDVAAVDETVQEISDATDDQARTTREVVDMVDGVASVSRQTATEAETVAAEEQTATVSEVAEQAQLPSERSDELSARLNEFAVPDGGGERGDGATGPENGTSGRPAAGAGDD